MISNLFRISAPLGDDEFFETILSRPGFRLERIISTGQCTPAGEWYDQAEDEWVVLISGAARIRFERESSPVEMNPGDHLLIPAGKRHRVDWTSTEERTVWLALFMPRDDDAEKVNE